MGKLTDQLDADLKKAMLAGDKELVSVLRGMKSSLQYAKVDGGGNELSEDEAVKILQKESKKRSDAADIYLKANDAGRAEKENYEKQIIDGYLPELLSDEEVARIVDEVIAEQGEANTQSMGKIIAEARQRSGGLAEGATIARLVKERINQ